MTAREGALKGDHLHIAHHHQKLFQLRSPLTWDFSCFFFRALLDGYGQVSEIKIYRTPYVWLSPPRRWLPKMNAEAEGRNIIASPLSITTHGWGRWMVHSRQRGEPQTSINILSNRHVKSVFIYCSVSFSFTCVTIII